MLRQAIKGKCWITVLHYLYHHYHLFSRPVTHSTSPSVPHNGKNLMADSLSCRFSTTEKLFQALYSLFSWNEFIPKTLFWTGTEADLNIIIFKKSLVRPLLLFDFKCAEMIYHWENYFTIPALTRYLLFPTSCFWCKESGLTSDLIWLLISRMKTLYRIICVQSAQQRYKEWNIISEHFPLMLCLK